MNEQRIIQALHESAEQAIPADVDLWPVIRARLQPRRRPSRWARLIPATRLGWALLVLAMFLVFGTAAYAIPAILSQTYHVEPGLQHIEQAKLGQDANLSQTMNSFTVTLQRVYADANRIVVGYTVIRPNPADRPYANSITPVTRLTDDKGTIFPSHTEASTGVYGSTVGNVSSFFADAVKGTPTVLHLHLVIDLVSSQIASDVTPVNGQPVEVHSERVAGPFTFDFDVPFDPGRVVQVHQMVEAAGIAMILEQVVIAPSETRAIVCFTSLNGDSINWQPGIATLNTGNRQNHTGGSVNFMQTRIGEKTCGRYSFLAPLEKLSGLWTLTVGELDGFDQTQPAKQIRLDGPWVFRFRVP